MIPLQTISNPTLAVVVVSIASIVLIHVGFIWAFKKIRAGAERHPSPESDGDVEHGHGA